jgi:hypothetical protein
MDARVKPGHDGCVVLRRFYSRHAVTISPHDLREFLGKHSALPKSEGAGKTGCALHPRSRVQAAHRKTHTSIQVQRKHSGLPRAMVLRLTSRSPWRPAFLPPSPLRSVCFSKDLTPASGRRDHTISPSASRADRRQHIRVHRIPPRVRDVAQRPSHRVRRAELCHGFARRDEAEYFSREDWTGFD